MKHQQKYEDTAAKKPAANLKTTTVESKMDPMQNQSTHTVTEADLQKTIAQLATKDDLAAHAEKTDKSIRELKNSMEESIRELKNSIEKTNDKMEEMRRDLNNSIQETNRRMEESNRELRKSIEESNRDLRAYIDSKARNMWFAIGGAATLVLAVIAMIGMVL